MSRSVIDLDNIWRWLTKALQHESNECLLWPFRVQVRGYGVFWDGEESHLAHRYVCRAAHGNPDLGEEAAHSCATRLCCNKRHLSWKSHAANLEDRRAHGTLPMGEKSYQAKLTEGMVLAIKASSRSQKDLAEDYGVAPGTVQAIKDGKSWKHLT